MDFGRDLNSDLALMEVCALQLLGIIMMNVCGYLVAKERHRMVI